MSTEFAEQAGLLQWFRCKYPDVLIFAIPNGGKRDIKTAKKLQMEGVTPGVPDLFVPAWNLWIEMKKPGGKLSASQKEMIEYLESIDHTVIIGYGARDASEKILSAFAVRTPCADV
jgi:hypothetical protein